MRPFWGATLVAMAVATLPRSVTDDVAVREHVLRLTGFLRERLANRVAPMAFHDRIMLLRAATALHELLPDADRAALISEVAARQRPDGGWSLASWGVGEFADPAGASDAYATAHALLALCEASGEATTIDHGLAWLAAAWQHDGSWPGHSVNSKDPEPTRFMSILMPRPPTPRWRSSPVSVGPRLADPTVRIEEAA